MKQKCLWSCQLQLLSICSIGTRYISRVKQYVLFVGMGSDWFVCVVEMVQTEDVSDWPDLCLRLSPYRDTLGCSASDMILFNLDLFSAPLEEIEEIVDLCKECCNTYRIWAAPRLESFDASCLLSPSPSPGAACPWSRARSQSAGGGVGGSFGVFGVSTFDPVMSAPTVCRHCSFARGWPSLALKWN